MTCIIVSDREDLRESLKLFMKYKWGNHGETFSFGKLIEKLSGHASDKWVLNKTFIIEFDCRRGDREDVLNIKHFPLDDPFNYAVCDLLATVLFDKRFYNKDDINTFLSRSVFFGTFSNNSIENNLKEVINYVEFPGHESSKEITTIEPYVKGTLGSKQKATDANNISELWSQMHTALESAFVPH